MRFCPYCAILTSDARPAGEPCADCADTPSTVSGVAVYDDDEAGDDLYAGMPWGPDLGGEG